MSMIHLIQTKLSFSLTLLLLTAFSQLSCWDDSRDKDREIRNLNLALDQQSAELEASRLEQGQKKNEVDQLIIEIAEIQGELQQTQKKIDFMKEHGLDSIDALKSLQGDRDRLLSDLDEKSYILSQIQTKLLDQSHFMRQIQDEKSLIETKLEKQNEFIKDLERKLANANAGNPDWGWLQNELKKAKTNLAETESKLADIESSLKELNYLGVQIYLENLGPERLFALDDLKLRNHYQYSRDLECLLLFSIDQRVQFLHNDPDRFIPNVSGFKVIPLSVSYHKIGICGPYGETSSRPVEIHYELGKIFKVIPEGNRNQRSLLTARLESSCYNQGSEVLDKNVFGRRFQIIYPYYGNVDGIESIAILHQNNRAVDYTMGSSILSVRAPSCEQVLERRHPDNLSHIACNIIENGVENEMPITLGCHTEMEGEPQQPNLIFFSN